MQLLKLSAKYMMRWPITAYMPLHGPQRHVGARLVYFAYGVQRFSGISPQVPPRAFPTVHTFERFSVTLFIAMIHVGTTSMCRGSSYGLP